MSTPPIYLAADEKQMDENKGKKTDKGSRTPPAPREPGCAQASDRASEPGSKEARQRASARERSRARAREGGREGGREGASERDLLVGERSTTAAKRRIEGAQACHEVRGLDLRRRGGGEGGGKVVVLDGV
jgi:hypothetical protein